MSILDTIAAIQPPPKTEPMVIGRPNVVGGLRTVEPYPIHEILGRSRPAVGPSPDLDRILALPTRPPEIEGTARAEALIELVTGRLRRERTTPCECQSKYNRPCISRLKFAQAWALYEAPLAGGILAPVAVGAGKTLCDILIATVMDCKLAVLLVPPRLVQQLVTEYKLCSEHFRVPSLIVGNTGHIVTGAPVVHVLPYSKFCREGSTNILEQLKPDLIIGDEVHRLRHAATATTNRVLRYFSNHPDTRFAGWSGTITNKSIKDYAHLCVMALREQSPLPLEPNVVEEWALALDPTDWPAPMGALRKLCKPGEHVYQGFHRRLVSTRGIVATKSSSCDASLIIDERKAPPIPEPLVKMLRVLRDKDMPGGWCRPDGEELIDALAVAACARQLACGFFYRWRFPKGESEELIKQWFSARKAWHRELREKLQHRVEHLDSPLLCERAAHRALMGDYDGDLPVWHAHNYQDWVAVKQAVYHETETVWVDEFLAKDAAEWARTHKGIVWYMHRAFGEKVAEISGLPRYGGGIEAETEIVKEKGDRSIIASIPAHGTGRDGLQYLFHEQLVADPPSSGAAWEQLCGRIHRIGQAEDEVTTEIYRHTPEFRDAIDESLIHAKYVSDTLGANQKLLAATCTFNPGKEQTVRDT